MLTIKKRYVVDENKRPFAVQVDIATFEKMEQLIEDYALGQLINENSSHDDLTLEEGKANCQKLKRK
jgi:RelB Antitoxin alpha helical domain